MMRAIERRLFLAALGLLALVALGAIGIVCMWKGART